MNTLTKVNLWQMVLTVGILGIIGCNQATPNVTQTPVTTAVAVDIPTVPPAIGLEESITNTQLDSDLPPAKFTLRVWMTTEVNDLITTPGGDMLAAQLQAFDNNHPDVALDVQVKSVVAQGGSLSYLRTGRAIAPNAMPDVVMLPSGELLAARNEGLIYPLDTLMSTNGLYPAAQDLGVIGDVLYGYPFTLTNFQHFVYNGNVITDDLPNSWSALIVQERAQAIFAAAGQQGAALAIQLYYAQGGALLDGENGFVFQRVPLTAMLEQLHDGKNSGVVQPASAEISISDDVWASFQSGTANVTMVDSSQLLQKRAEGNTSLFGAIPGPNEPTTPLVQGWVYAISTPDATRQALSAELITWLTDTSNLGQWSASALRLPSKPAAFDSWGSDPYINYIKAELPLAKAYPKTLGSAEQNALSNAIVSIISSSITPEAAADFVIQTLSP